MSILKVKSESSIKGGLRILAEIIFCACGCGQKLFSRDKKGRQRKYIYGHQNHGHHSETSKKKKRIGFQGNGSLVIVAVVKCLKIGIKMEERGNISLVTSVVGNIILMKP